MQSPWTPLLPVIGHTVVVYLFLTLMFRVFGRRQLAQLNVIDLVVIIVMGSAVETAMVNGNVTLPAGLVCCITLLILDRTLAFTVFRSRRFSHLLCGGPVMLVHDGRYVEENLKRAGLTEADVLQALRGREHDGLKGIRFAVLEPDGSVNVVAADVKTLRGKRKPTFDHSAEAPVETPSEDPPK